MQQKIEYDTYWDEQKHKFVDEKTIIEEETISIDLKEIKVITIQVIRWIGERRICGKKKKWAEFKCLRCGEPIMTDMGVVPRVCRVFCETNATFDKDGYLINEKGRRITK